MFILDRLYGRLIFPPIIRSLLDCPGLLRLREVGMANVPFFSFPSFTAVTRYEHSLGVCHLADIVAINNDLSETNRIELMLAALYHDVATPPFAHAMEEVLNELFGFDHETRLRELFLGRQSLSAGPKSQMFLGHSLKIHKVCQSKEGRRLKLDALRIADIATGKDSDALGDIICSNGIDLDNIDNVVRAATAMGMKEVDLSLPEIIANSFVYRNNKFQLDEGSSAYFKNWQEIRSTLYGMIFASQKDFALQTMLKEAIKLLPREKLNENDWRLTDNQLIYEKLLLHEPSAEIVRRMRLGKTFECLLCLIIEGDDIIKNKEFIAYRLKEMAEEQYIEYIDRAFVKKENLDTVRPNISVNYYIDKRKRKINRSLIFLDRITHPEKEDRQSQKLIYGIFTSNNRGWDRLAIDRLIQKASVIIENINAYEIKIDLSDYPRIRKELPKKNDIIN